MNRAWRSRAIRKIGFFAILAVLGIMVVRWILFVRAQAMPTTLDMTYSNQQNNKRAGLAFTMVCTPFTGHPVEGVLLCGTHMSTKGNV